MHESTDSARSAATENALRDCAFRASDMLIILREVTNALNRPVPVQVDDCIVALSAWSRQRLT
jgi:hypothetical protein